MFWVIFVLFHSFSRGFGEQGSSERHYLHYMITATTKADSFNFRSLVLCDDGQISHYCNDTKAWIGEILIVDGLPGAPDYTYWYKNELLRLSDCTGSLCPELHVLQRKFGCELEKLPDGSVNLTVFDDYGFDGEDFISFDYDTMQWIDKNPKAKETKEKWDRQTGRNHFIKHYLKKCMDWISTFNITHKSPPHVHVFASKSPDDGGELLLTCLATGFYPRDVEMNIRLNRINLEDQTSSGIRPNHDETFQKRISVKIDKNHEGSYDCLVTHSSLTEPVSVNWDGKCSDCESESQWTGVIAGVLAGVALIGICCCIIKMRRSNDLNRNSPSYGAVI